MKEVFVFPAEVQLSDLHGDVSSGAVGVTLSYLVQARREAGIPSTGEAFLIESCHVNGTGRPAYIDNRTWVYFIMAVECFLNAMISRDEHFIERMQAKAREYWHANQVSIKTVVADTGNQGQPPAEPSPDEAHTSSGG